MNKSYTEKEYWDINVGYKKITVGSSDSLSAKLHSKVFFVTTEYNNFVEQYSIYFVYHASGITASRI